MNDLQHLLLKRFSELRDARRGAVFLVEHGLSCGELKDLRCRVRASLRAYPLETEWWDRHDLPLLIAATEVGYRYRGSGTDFWPLLEDELQVELQAQSRLRIKDFFDRAAIQFRGVRPPATAWARAFHLIAWPIAHALLPVEFHRPFATTLANLRVNVGEADDVTLYRAVIIAARFPSARFATLLGDMDLVVSLTRRLLGKHCGDLSAEIIDRLSGDLEADDVARRGVAVARSIQRASRGTRGALIVPTVSEVMGTLQLRLTNGVMTLEAVFPPLDSDTAGRLRAALRRRRFAPRLWGVTARVPSDNLLSGLPFALQLAELPAQDALLFPELNLDGLDPHDVALLQSFQLPLHFPLLFVISADGEIARQVRGCEITGYRRYWLLHQKGAEPSRLPVVSELGPLLCFDIDPEQEVGAKALMQLGYKVQFGISVRFAGPPPASPHDVIPAFLAGEHRVLVPLRLPEDATLRIFFNGSSCVANASEVVRVVVGTGEQLLEIASDSDARSFPFRGIEAVSPPLAAVQVALRCEERTIGALLSGRLCFVVDGFAPISGLQLSLELEVAGRRFSATGVLETLPQAVSADHPVLNKLLDDDVREVLWASGSVTLRVQVGHLAVASWELEQTLRPCWWDSRAAPRLLSESGPLQFGVVCACDPVLPPAERPPGDDAYLLAPVALDSKGFGAAAPFTSLCLVPPRVQLALPSVSKPRIERRRRGTGSAVGLEDLFEAYLRWSLAETRSLVGNLRRGQVTMLLDSWLCELCCGEEWARIEEAIPHRSPWALLEQGCSELSIGRNSHLALTVEQEAKVRRLAIAEIRRSMPALWTSVGPPSDLGAGDYEALDGAFASAYMALAKAYRARGNEGLADELDAADPGDDPALWDQALGRAHDATELRGLAALLLPSNSAQHLMAIDVGDLTVDEVADELVTWAKHSRAAFAGAPPTRDTLKAVYSLWVEPELTLAVDWRGSLDTLLAERAVARATRYLAVKARDARRSAA